MTAQETGPSSPLDPGVVYILENEAFAVSVVKIGRTGQQDWVSRIKQLNTAVPLPFTCAKASRVDDMGKVETFFHQTFAPAKRQWRGEFYEVEAWRVAQVLELFETEDVTELAPVPDPDEEKAINTTVGNKEPSITVAHAVKVSEGVSCNDTAWPGPDGAVSTLTNGWSGWDCHGAATAAGIAVV